MVPQDGWLIMETPILKWMNWGYLHFRKFPYPPALSTLHYQPLLTTIDHHQLEPSFPIINHY